MIITSDWQGTSADASGHLPNQREKGAVETDGSF